MTFDQVAKWPAGVLFDAFKGLEWFCMIDEEAGIDTRNSTVGDFRIEETSPYFSVLEVTDWRRFHDRFPVIVDEGRLNVVDISCDCQTPFKDTL